MEQIYIFHLEYYNESAQNGQQALMMHHNQHARPKEMVIDVLDTNYDSALAQAKAEYRRQNHCSVFGDDRSVRVVHWENG